MGRYQAPTEILIQVVGLDSIYEIAKGWMAVQGGQSSPSEIGDTTWKSRMFTVEPVPGTALPFGSGRSR